MTRHLALVGTTASGKSALAMTLARRSPGTELISIDSMQVYRGMDIGTAKATPDEQAEVRHHLIDLADPHEGFAVTRFQQAFRLALADVESRGARAVLVGGTGLYLRAVIDDLEIPGRFPDVVSELEAKPDTEALHRQLMELDPIAADRMEPSNRRRVVRALEVTLGSGRPFSSFGPGLDTYPESQFRLVGVRLPRPVIDERINARYDEQMAAGFLEEVAGLQARVQGISPTARQALGYRELIAHLDGEIALDDALAEAKVRTRRFARRQERWFRRDPRIHWLDVEKNPMVVLDALLGEWALCN